MFRASFWLALLILAVPGLASADSSFTVKNECNRKVRLEIYNGDDSICFQYAKSVTVDAEGTKSVSCTGGGKHRCRVAVMVPDFDDDEACEYITSSCSSEAVVDIPDGKTLTVQANYSYCSVN